MKEILLITPPFTQLNTPYPATAYLKGFLNTKGISCYQMDLGIEVILALFTPNNLSRIFQLADQSKRIHSENAKRIFFLQDAYLMTINEVITFLQGKRPTLSRRIVSRNFLPEASRFNQLEDMEWAFGHMGNQDLAKHLATLYLEDLSDFIVECVDKDFGFSRYAERIARSANSFNALYQKIKAKPSFIDELGLNILAKTINKSQPLIIGFSVPFPGNLYSALRCAHWIKSNFPKIKTIMGGGFPNTELRSLKDKRVFEFFDYITLDDGELPLEIIASNVKCSQPSNPDYQLYKRTFLMDNNDVAYNDYSLKTNYKQKDLGTPDYSDLKLEKYISVIEVANPMHSLWSDGRWNKLTMAHGCYWGKCTFCDVSLDYIKSYEPITAKLMVDRMEAIIQQTDETGFHFVDEAAPPKLMAALAREILFRNLKVTWWTNIRFEKRFTRDLCRLLAASGCIAVSGGLEVASDRLLALIKKGVTVEQVAQVSRNLTEAGIMVHAYLMYGFPTQTIQETVDSLEMVRQCFEAGIIQSGFWHQFALTAHSPVGINPEKYAIIPEIKPISFAENDVQFEDKTGIDHNKFSFGLKKSIYNFMHGLCFDFSLQEWFDFNIPPTQVSPNFIRNCIAFNNEIITHKEAKILWLGQFAERTEISRKNKGVYLEKSQLKFHNKTDSLSIVLEKEKADWLLKILALYNTNSNQFISFSKLKTNYEESFDSFDLFWYSKEISKLKSFGLLAY